MRCLRSSFYLLKNIPMFKLKHVWIQLSLIVVMFFAGWYFYGCLPEVITTHRNINGIADGFQNKNVLTVFLLPFITFVVLGGMKFTPYIDPRKEKYKQFQGTYDIIQTVIVALFTYFYGVFILLNLDSSRNISTFLLLGIGIMLVLVGNYLPKIKQNYFVGIRTPWAIHDEDNWNKTHRMWGICYVLLGISLILNAYFCFLLLWHLIFMGGVMILPIVYSFFLSVRKRKNLP